MKNHLDRLFLPGIFIAAVSATTRAQTVPALPYLTVPQRCAFLVEDPHVAKSLNLTPAQSKALTQASQQYTQTTTKLVKLKAPKDTDFRMNDEKFANVCLGTLTPKQKQTVLQLGLREIGLEAIADPSISAKLGLSPAQAEKISDLYAIYEKKAEDVSGMVANGLLALPEPKKGADRTAYEKKRMQIVLSYQAERDRLVTKKAEADKAALKILTPVQIGKWQTLVGMPAKK